MVEPGLQLLMFVAWFSLGIFVGCLAYLYYLGK